MIAYFDTSAVIPLIISEPSTSACSRIWNAASRVVSVRLVYPEARAALARAERMNRITRAAHAAAVTELDSILTQLDLVEVTADLAQVAGDLAQAQGLRGYDAVHLAGARSLSADDVVVVTGDVDLAAAAAALGLAVGGLR